MSDPYEILPGDEIKITVDRVVSSFDGSTVGTTEGEEFSTWDIEYEIDSVRPNYWPPQDHDVWETGHGYYVHVLNSEFHDEGDNYDELAEYLEHTGVAAADMKLAFRPGIVDARTKSK